MLIAQEKFVPNYDETKIPKYRLPDPLILNNGMKVQNKEIWRNVRRPELLTVFAEEMFGKTPETAKKMQGKCRYELLSEKKDALDGKATRKEVRIHLTDKAEGPCLDLLIYLPNNAKKPVPAFLGLNFQGNQSVTDEPDVMITESWCMNQEDDGRVVDHKSTEKSRGAEKSRWPVAMILDRDYALVVGYYGDIDPDFDDGFKNGVQPYFYRDGQAKPDPDEWGSIGAWAWGLSRGLDYLETENAIDARHVVVFGHSRLGKTALWAAAQDDRFAMAISNDSGCGGAALSKREFGETVGSINAMFPHWFCDNFNKYNNNEQALTFDQHELIALIAPRPVYVASAEKDEWADPRGELLGAVNADAVYRLLGTDGIGDVISKNATIADDGMIYEIKMPPLNAPTGATIHYHIRSGVHDVTDYDWEQYLDFVDRYL